MLFFLLGALASRYQAGNKWGHVPAFALLGLLLLPATQEYAHMEGSTMPMTFFTVLGFVQCTNWLLGKDPARLGLGLTFLFGGAMTHLEGLIFMALAAGWILLLPSARPGWKLPPAFWRVLAFWFLAALPYACLRVRIPSLHFESGWAGYALHHPGSTLLIWPCIFLIQSARMFAGPDWANWAGDDGQIHWIGKWDGLSSLYDPATLGLTWLCLLLTIVLWVALPARRRVIIWPLAMFFGAAIAFSGVFASLLSVQGLSETINYTLTGGRYLFPVLAAWYAAILTILFAGPPDATSSQATSPARMPDLNLAGSKEGGWLVAGACLILVLGIFVFPNHEPAAPENRLENAVPPSSPADSGTQVAGNPDLQARMERAVQLDKAGRFAESIQEYREVARLYPDDPMALNNLAWSLAANPRHELRNGREAVALASRAVELTGQQQAVFIGTLAAAYAEDGQFAKAVETAKLARTIALLKCQLQVAEINDQLLKLYSTGKTVGLTNGP